MMSMQGDNEAHELAVSRHRSWSGRRPAYYATLRIDTTTQGGEDGEHGERLNDYDGANILESGLAI